VSPEEVGDIVRLLASDAASHVTGQTVAPTGTPWLYPPP